MFRWSERLNPEEKVVDEVRQLLMGELYQKCASGKKVSSVDIEKQIKTLKAQGCLDKSCDLSAFSTVCKLQSTAPSREDEELATLYHFASALSALAKMLIHTKIPFAFKFYPHKVGSSYCLFPKGMDSMINIHLLNFDKTKAGEWQNFLAAFENFSRTHDLPQPFVLLFTFVNEIGRTEVLHVDSRALP